MYVGYQRISTNEQSTLLQTDALNRVGCEQIFEDVASGARTDRPQLEECLKFMRQGDTLVVWRLDRLGRSLSHLLKIISDLEERGIKFKSIQEGMDTETPAGKMLFSIVGALSEFERSIIRERTNSGLASARARGRVGGRPRALTTKQIERASKLMMDRDVEVNDICNMFNISRTTLYKYVKEYRQKMDVTKCELMQH